MQYYQISTSIVLDAAYRIYAVTWMTHFSRYLYTDIWYVELVSMAFESQTCDDLDRGKLKTP